MKHLSFILVLASIFFTNVQIRGQSIEDQILQSLSTLDQSQTNAGLLYDMILADNVQVVTQFRIFVSSCLCDNNIIKYIGYGELKVPQSKIIKCNLFCKNQYN